MINLFLKFLEYPDTLFSIFYI